MNLKQYVVVQDDKGKPVIWGTKNYKAAKEFHADYYKDFKILATFDKDEELKEGGGMTAEEFLKSKLHPDMLWDNNTKLDNVPIAIVGGIMDEYAAQFSSAEPAGEGWVSVEPGNPLPEKRIRVHGWDGFIIWEAYIDIDGQWKWMYPEHRGEAWQETKTITHWRPLPAPPKKENV